MTVIVRDAIRPSETRLMTSRTECGGPDLVSADYNHLSGSFGPAFFVVWKRVVETRVAERTQARIREHASRMRNKRAVLLTIVEAGAPMPSADARAALANILRYCADDLLASAVVMEGDGFRAAAVRSVATGLSLVARQPFPHRVFPTTGMAAGWLAECLQTVHHTLGAPYIASALDELRAEDRQSEFQFRKAL